MTSYDYKIPPKGGNGNNSNANGTNNNNNSSSNSHSKQRIAYFHNHDVSRYHYGEGHPMKPARLALTNDLILNFGLYKDMNVYQSRKAAEEELNTFHSSDYLEFLKAVSANTAPEFTPANQKFNIGVEDCPTFDGMFDFCRLYSGASLEGARKLISGATDIAVNWSGGLHHAKKWEASGFCYINDIVLAIIEMLRYYPRVLYIDIDVHHGDGVQEAFYHTDRVMTVSFHRYDGQFFPGTGAVDEIGEQNGKYYSINVPLQENIDDNAYFYIFSSVMSNVMEVYRPSAIVLQCGADSLACDRLGCFNLSIKGHGRCVEYMRDFNIPMLVLGGGGYTIRNVARCWAYETSVLTRRDLPDQIPETSKYIGHFSPDFTLHPIIVQNQGNNFNTRQYLDAIRIRVAEYLRYLQGAPSVQMAEIPPSIAKMLNGDIWDEDMHAEDEEDKNPEAKGEGWERAKRGKEKRIYDPAEYYDDEKDQDLDLE